MSVDKQFAPAHRKPENRARAQASAAPGKRSWLIPDSGVTV